MIAHKYLNTQKEPFNVNCTTTTEHACKILSYKWESGYNLQRSLRQSSFSFNLSLISPDISDEYGQAISLKKPLISSWKPSISLSPVGINKCKTNGFLQKHQAVI